MSLCSLLNTSRKGVQAARIPGPFIESRRQPVPSEETEIGGIFVSSTLNTPRFKVHRDSGVDPVYFCSARVLGSKANHVSRTA